MREKDIYVIREFDFRDDGEKICYITAPVWLNRSSCTQERGLRAVFRDSKSTYEQLLKKANLKFLYERRLQDIACLMFKVRHNLCPPTVKNLFSLKSSTYNLRGADFHIPRFNTVTYGKHSLRYIGPLLWNRLSTNIKTSPSLQSFKKQICLTNLSSKLEYDCENCVLCSTWTIIWLRNTLCVYLI